MNRKLKGKIIENFGTQADFAQILKVDDSIISKIVRGRRSLPDGVQKVWANLLNCKREEIFPVENSK